MTQLSTARHHCCCSVRPRSPPRAPGRGLAGIYLALLPSALGFVLWGYAVARLPVAASTSLLSGAGQLGLEYVDATCS